MIVQPHELDAWLGDDHGLDDDQVKSLLATAGEIERRYQDPDDADLREAALTVAYRLMVESPDDVVDELGAELTRARAQEVRTWAALQQAALTLIIPGATKGNGVRSEGGFAQRAGVDRMTVRRRWLGRA